MNSTRSWAWPVDVAAYALDADAEVAAAASELGAARGRPVAVRVRPSWSRAGFTALDHLRVDGRAPAGFAPQSGFVAASDGWVRTHGNYPHHAAALHRVLGSDLAAGIAARPAEQVQEDVTAAGGVAVAVRIHRQWVQSAPGRALALAAQAGDGGCAGPRDVDSEPGRCRPLPSTPDLPAAGLRVLDLTRVIAGPTATAVLAAFGATVLRVDPPAPVELLDQHLDRDWGKRTTTLDLRDRADRERLHELAAAADVLVTGYRPGALDAFGVGASQMRQRHPHLVHVAVTAWGGGHPWSRRRGFDSIVQAAVGIADLYGDASRPGALPAQALDHAVGRAAAAEVMRQLARRSTTAPQTTTFSLAGAAHALLGRRCGQQPQAAEPAEACERVATVTVDSPYGPLTHVPPPYALDGQRMAWPDAPRRYGADPPTW